MRTVKYRVLFILLLSFVVFSGCSSDKNPVAPETEDITAPAPVSDLTVWARDEQSMTIAWSPAGDDGALGQATSYDIRYADYLIDQSNWSSAIEVAAPTPGSGVRDMVTITNIDPLTVYYVALRASDEQGNWSAISNVLQVSTDQMKTWYITDDGTGDLPSIQAAVTAAGARDLILVAPGRYTWTSQNTENSEYKDYAMVMFWRGVDGFTLRSEAGPTETILDAEGNGRVMELQADNDNVVVEGFTLTGGDAIVAPQGYQGGGALVLHLTGPLLRNCIFTENLAKYGGAVEMAGECAATFYNCRFVENEAQYGGALYGIKSHLTTTFLECVFASNTAFVTGGAVVSDTTSIHLVDCQIYDNQAGDLAGAFLFFRSNPCVLSGCTIADNRAVNGHAVQLRNGAPVTVENCIIANNISGGAIIIDESSTLSVGCTNVFGHSGGDELLPEIQDLGGNFYSDPLFFDEDNFDYHLQSRSPCLPGDSECGQIGALGLSGFDP